MTVPTEYLLYKKKKKKTIFTFQVFEQDFFFLILLQRSYSQKIAKSITMSLHWNTDQIIMYQQVIY